MSNLTLSPSRLSTKELKAACVNNSGSGNIMIDLNALCDEETL